MKNLPYLKSPVTFQYGKTVEIGDISYPHGRRSIGYGIFRSSHGRSYACADVALLIRLVRRGTARGQAALDLFIRDPSQVPQDPLHVLDGDTVGDVFAISRWSG